ncbi:MAG TPA: lytic transglycosylase domain-containing protein [Fimbriimonas sp.]|nr:lytic transglycosylase domain-containing protein [Fimbriimonas sp.]
MAAPATQNDALGNAMFGDIAKPVQQPEDDLGQRMFGPPVPTGGGKMFDQYYPLVQKTESKYGLPPGLLHNVIKVESDYTNLAPNSKGAMGIAQFTLPTAKGFGIDPMQPYQAIDAAGKYLSQNIAKYKGNVAKALAAYNAGPGAVDKYGDVPPYPETQAYVKTILGRLPSAYNLESWQQPVDTSGVKAVNVTRQPGASPNRPPQNPYANAFYEMFDPGQVEQANRNGQTSVLTKTGIEMPIESANRMLMKAQGTNSISLQGTQDPESAMQAYINYGQPNPKTGEPVLPPSAPRLGGANTLRHQAHVFAGAQKTLGGAVLDLLGKSQQVAGQPPAANAKALTLDQGNQLSEAIGTGIENTVPALLAGPAILGRAALGPEAASIAEQGMIQAGKFLEGPVIPSLTGFAAAGSNLQEAAQNAAFGGLLEGAGHFAPVALKGARAALGKAVPEGSPLNRSVLDTLRNYLPKDEAPKAFHVDLPTQPTTVSEAPTKTQTPGVSQGQNTGSRTPALRPDNTAKERSFQASPQTGYGSPDIVQQPPNTSDASIQSPPPKPTLGLMSEDQLNQYREQIRAYEKGGAGDPKTFLGDRYKQWKALDKEGDYGAIQKLVSPPEWQKIYGEGPTHSLADVDAFISKTNSIRHAQTPQELGMWLRHDWANLKENPDLLLTVDNKIKSEGWDPKQVYDNALLAHSMMSGDLEGSKAVLGPRPEAQANVPALPRGPKYNRPQIESDLAEAIKKGIPQQQPVVPQSFSSAEGHPFTEERMNPNDIGVYPGLQYKKVGVNDPENAVTDALKGSTSYDQATGGPLTVWETSDGNRYVMNGHHRRELAIRTGEPTVPVRVFRESDGINFDTARALGALQNLRDGKGTAIDAVSVLRDLRASPEQLKAYGLNPRSGVARDAMSLMRLSPESIRMVEGGDVPEAAAAGIADAKLDPRRELATMKEAAKGDIETRSQGATLAELARTAPIIDRSGGTGDLFGEFDEGLALKERAKIADMASRNLAASQRMLLAMTRGRAVGETIVDKTAQTEAAARQEFARKVIATDPETARILEEAAATYASNPSKKTLGTAVQRVVDAAESASGRRLSELGKPSGLAEDANHGLSPRAEVKQLAAGNDLFAGHPEDLELKAPEASKAKKPAAPVENPVGKQLTLAPETLGEKSGQLGMDLRGEAPKPSVKQFPKPLDMGDLKQGETVLVDGKPMKVGRGGSGSRSFHDIDANGNEKATGRVVDSIDQQHAPVWGWETGKAQQVGSKTDGVVIERMPQKPVTPEKPAPVTVDKTAPEARAELIDRVVEAVRKDHQKRIGQPFQVIEFQGTDGKWYRANGFPKGVGSTGEKRAVGWVTLTPDGTTVGQRYPSKEAWVEAQKAREDEAAKSMRDALESSDDQRIAEQAKYWLRSEEKRATPEASSSAPKLRGQQRRPGSESHSTGNTTRPNSRTPSQSAPSVPESSAKATPTESPQWKKDAKKELDDLQGRRFKTAGQEQQIKFLQDALKKDTTKLNIGDGVGIKRFGQTNRGLAIVDIDHNNGMVKVRQVADTGLTTSGGNNDRIADEWVHIGSIVRDKKYDLNDRAIERFSKTAEFDNATRPKRTLSDIRADRAEIVQDLKDSLHKGNIGSGVPSNLPEILGHVGRYAASLYEEGKYTTREIIDHIKEFAASHGLKLTDKQIQKAYEDHLGENNARPIESPTEDDGHLRTQPIESEGQVPVTQSSEGVRQNPNQEPTKQGSPQEVNAQRPRPTEEKPLQQKGTQANEADQAATGLARRFENPEREAKSQEPLPAKGVTAKQMSEHGRQLVESGKIDPRKVIRDTSRVPTNDEATAIAYYKRQIANRSNEITDHINKEADPVTALRLQEEQKSLADEMDLIHSASQRIRGNWHEGGMALQAAYNPDFSHAALTAQAKAANLGESLSSSQQKIIDQHAQTILSLQKELDSVKSQLTDSLKAQAPPKAGSLSPKDRAGIIARMRKLTGAETMKEPVGAGGLRSRQRGAVDFSTLDAQQKALLAKDARALAQHYVSDGAKSVNELLSRFAEDLPHLSEENVLDLLSGKYKGTREALTAEKLRLRQSMNAIAKVAQFRQKTELGKAFSVASGIVNGLSRNLKLAIHASAPFMQGRKPMFVDPRAWLQSWGPMLKGYVGGDKAANAQLARFMNDPLWEKAKAAGMDEVMAKPHGTVTEMEESLAADLVNKIPALGKVFEHSGAAFNGFLNEARWQMFKHASQVAPNDPDFLHAMAHEIGTMTGRSISKEAKGSAPLGGALFSPRYTVSKWEYSLGRPLWAAKTRQARNMILQRYAKVAAGNVIIGLAAKQLLGAKLDLDPESSSFGTMELGKNRIDMFAQEGEPAKVIAQALLGAKSEAGKVSPAEPMSTVGRYIGNKLTPAVRLPVDLAQGIYNSEGQHTKGVLQKGNPKFDYTQELKNLLEPIVVQSAEEGYRRGANLAPELSPLGIMTRPVVPKKANQQDQWDHILKAMGSKAGV